MFFNIKKSFQRGRSAIEVEGKQESLDAFHLGRVKPGKKMELEVGDGGVVITVKMA